jgi:hypothetical protein
MVHHELAFGTALDLQFIGICSCGKWQSKISPSVKKIEGWHSAHVKGCPKVWQDERYEQ